MHSFSGFAVSYLVNALWEGALIYLAAWLASRLLRRMGPQAEHAVWVSALFAMVVTPALQCVRQLLALFPGWYATASRGALILVADQGSAARRAGFFPLSQTWFWWLLAIYFAAMVLFAGRLLLSLRGAARLLRQARPATLAPEQEELWRRCRVAFSLHRARILASAQAPGPVALGLDGPALLLPGDFAARCAREDFLAALVHECAHLRRRDFEKNLFYEAASMAVAFHPLVWAVKSRIAQTREMICDAMATQGEVDARSYARSLLRLAAMVATSGRVSAIHAIGIFDAGNLEKRIMRIRMKKEHAGAVVRCGLIGAASAILLCAAGGAAAMAVQVAPQAGSQDSAQASAYGHVYHVGQGVSAPIPLNVVEAEFPPAARKDKKVPGGIVLLRMIVDAEGMPRDVHVVRSYRPDFDAEAVKAVKNYRFGPAMLKGKPVAVSITVEVNFKRY